MRIDLSLMISSLLCCSAFAADHIYTQQELETVQHLPHPLRTQALDFQRVWGPLYGNLQTNELAQYVNDVIHQDGAKTVQLQNIIPYTTVRLERSEENTIDDFWQNVKTTFKNLRKKKNAFAQYFQGFFIAQGYDYIKKSEEENEDDFKNNRLAKAAQFLKAAHDQFYVRAVRFIKAHERLREKIQLTKEDLKLTELIVLKSEEAILRFVKTHSSFGSIIGKDLEKLEYILNTFSNDPAPYRILYENLAQKLSRSLSAHKEKEEYIRLFGTTAISALGVSALSVTFGVSNIIQGNYEKTTNSTSTNATPPEVTQTIGSLQAATGVLSLVAAGAVMPTVSNFIYRFNWEGFSFTHLPLKWGHLLPFSLSSDEISKQSHLVALYAIFSNKNNIQEDMERFLGSYRYTRKLRKLILSSYEGETHALSKVIITKNKSYFESR